MKVSLKEHGKIVAAIQLGYAQAALQGEDFSDLVASLANREEKRPSLG